MPVYEYRCAACGHLTEQLRPMKDVDQPIKCELCGSRKTARVHSLFSAHASGASRPEFACPVSPSGGCCGCGNGEGACGL
jgi:putative FmdB family regulatory protein